MHARIPIPLLASDSPVLRLPTRGEEDELLRTTGGDEEEEKEPVGVGTGWDGRGRRNVLWIVELLPAPSLVFSFIICHEIVGFFFQYFYASRLAGG